MVEVSVPRVLLRWQGGARIRLGGFVVLASLVGFACAPNRAKRPEDTMARSDMERSVTEARTPQDHRAIADMYERHATAAQASAKRHAELAAFYRQWGIPGRGAGSSPMAAHCDLLAEQYAQVAKEYGSLAEIHRTAGDR